MLTKDNQKEFDNALETLETVLEDQQQIPREPYKKEIWTIERMLVMALLNKEERERVISVLENTERRGRAPNAMR